MAPMQRMHTVGKFVIKYGTPVREKNPKLPTEEELANSEVTLLEGKERRLFHAPKVSAGGPASKLGAALFATTTAEQNERAGKSDVDAALHPLPPTVPALAPEAKADEPGGAKSGGKADAVQAKKEAAKMDKNVPKAIPKPILPDGKPVKMKVSEFGEPRVISAGALLDVYDAIVKKLTDRGLIGVYVITELNPRQPDPKQADVRAPGVMDVKVTVFLSEVAKIRTIARKIPFKLTALPKINDDEARTGSR